MNTASTVESTAKTPMHAAGKQGALKKQTWHLGHVRPGEGEATEPAGPVNWHRMEDDEYDDTWGALCDFLGWALPRWGFTTDQIPHLCWWLHEDIVEELTAWWGLWQAHVRNPKAPIHTQMDFQEQTFQLKGRLDVTYRGRCRHEHQPMPVLVVHMPA